MDGAVLAILNKLRKGLKGSVNLNLLPQVFEHLPGWSMSEKVTAVPLSNPGSLSRLLDSLDGFYTSSEGWCYFQFRTAEARDHVMDLIRKSHPSIGDLVGPKGPVSPEFEHRYFTEPLLGNPWNSTDPWMGRYFFRCKKAWIGVMARVIQAPDGDKGEIPILQKVTDFSSDRLWKFLYSHGAKEQAAEVLEGMGDAKVRQVLSPSTIRTLDGTGTCGVCMANVKLSGQRIMRHGWNVQGTRSIGTYGNTWHTGPCFGAGYLPFELSPKACQDFLPQVEKYKESVEEGLRNLKSGKVTEFTDRYKNVTKQGDRDFAYLLKSAIEGAERKLKAIEEDIRTLKARIQTWEPKPLPSGIG